MLLDIDMLLGSINIFLFESVFHAPKNPPHNPLLFDWKIKITKNSTASRAEMDE